MIQPDIRVARPDDLRHLRALVEGTYRGDSARRGWTHEADLLTDERTTDADLVTALADPDHVLLVAEVEDGLVGTVTTVAAGPGRAYLGMLSVAPDRQGSGLGRALIAAAERAAIAHFGAAVMEMTVIDVRHELIAWYERLGYQRTGERRPFPGVSSRPVDFGMVVLERRL